MAKPKAPTPPDPKETAAAQTGTNVSTALANTFLGNVNQVTPYGSLTYSYGGLEPMGAGAAAQPSETLPAALTGGGSQPAPAPDYAAQQRQFIAERDGGAVPTISNPGATRSPAPTATSGGGASQNANGGFTITDPTTGATYTIPQITATTTLSPEQQAILDQTQAAELGLATLGNQQVGRLANTLGTDLNYDGIRPGGQADNLYVPQYGAFSAGNPLQTGLAFGAGQGMQMGLEGMQYGASGAGRGLTSSVSGAGQGLVRSVDGAGVGIVNGMMNGYDPVRGLQFGVDSGGQRQMSLDMSGVPQFTGQIAGAGPITRDYGPEDGFSEDRRRVEEALLSRLNPDLEREREALRTELINQGISLGSTAYDRGMDIYGRQANDARYGAILAGGQEQSRLMGLERDRAYFQNAAQQQQFGQNAAQAEMERQAALYNANRALMEGNFANAAADSQFAENLARGNFANAAQGQGFGQSLALSQFANQAQEQGFNQRAFNAQLNNAAQGQGFDQRAFNAQLGNAAQAQGFDQRFRNVGVNNAARQAEGVFANAAQGQAFGQGVDAGNFFNVNTQQNNDNAFRATSANNMTESQRLSDSQAIFDAQNLERDRAIAERTNLRNAPINEIAALLSGTGVTNPQFVNTSSAQIPTVDYAGLVQNNYANQMNAWQQQNAAVGNMWGNLIGAAGNIGAGYAYASDRRLKADIEPAGEANGVRWYRYRYLWDAPQVRRLGVMAQEVGHIPGAVIRMANGFLAVDYSRILGRA